MSKHDVIADNLMALTHCRSLKRAFNGWWVKKLIALTKGLQACELCGTRFRHGAVVVHSTSKATVVVGGTCLRTLQRHRFSTRREIGEARQFAQEVIRTRYGALVDPGNWILWIHGHAPPRLAQPAADLYLFGAVVDRTQLDALIRFHDEKRLFPSDALLGNVDAVGQAVGMAIPDFITIAGARRLSRRAQRLGAITMIGAAAAQFSKRVILPRVRQDPELQALWRGLGSHSRRAVTALAALDSVVADAEAILVDDSLAKGWPHPRTPPMFVWNCRVGLGFVSQDDVFEPPKAHVWLWRSGRYRKAIYNLEFWRGVVGCSEVAVGQLEELAFGDPGRSWLL